MQTKINYDDAINILTSREKFHICLGLERISKVLNLLGNPQKNLNIIHIAGTNGKGSVSKILSEILKYAGYKTGLYTSPHIIDYTERIQINGKCIEKGTFADLISVINNISKTHDIYLTEFEVLTAVMFKYFSDRNTDICVIETGLGGRLDATNAIDKNLLSIITSISFDHTDRLGNTIDMIATEKSGILKKNCPVIVNQTNKGFNVIATKATECKSPLVISENIPVEYKNNLNYAVIDNKECKFNLMGLWQKENLGLAYTAIKYLRKNGYILSENSIEKALENVSWPCRFQYLRNAGVIIDGTHNPDGARLLRKSLDYYFPDIKRTWVYGSMKNKNYETIMDTLFREEDTIYLCEFQHTGSASISDLAQKIHHDFHKISIENVESLIVNKKNQAITIISGSFYMIGEILKLNKKIKNIAQLDNT